MKITMCKLPQNNLVDDSILSYEESKVPADSIKFKENELFDLLKMSTQQEIVSINWNEEQTQILANLCGVFAKQMPDKITALISAHKKIREKVLTLLTTEESIETGSIKADALQGLCKCLQNAGVRIERNLKHNLIVTEYLKSYAISELEQWGRKSAPKVTAGNVEILANFCIDYASKMPEAVKALLLRQDDVQKKALLLLVADEKRSQIDQLSLAMCLLEVGIPIKMHNQHPEEVNKLLRSRESVNEQSKSPSPNEPVNEQGKSPSTSCWSYVDNVDSVYPFKHLRLYSQKKEWDWSLEKRSAETKFTPINFTPDNFGKLMIQLAFGLQPGETCSFRVEYRVHGRSVEMKGLLKKDTNDGIIELSLYEKNTTDEKDGFDILDKIDKKDIPRKVKSLKGLPEEIASLNLNDFDPSKEWSPGREPVWLLYSDHGNLANVSSESFVATDHKSQVASLVQALASGDNISEVYRVKSYLLDSKSTFQGDDIQRLSFGLFSSLWFGRNVGLAAFTSLLIDLHKCKKLEEKQIVEIVSAQEDEEFEPFLCMALQCEDVNKVGKYLDLLNNLVVKKVISFEGARSLLIGERGERGSNIRTMVKSGSPTIVSALAKLVKEFSEIATPDQAAKLLRDLRSAKGANRWYLLGAWKNYKSYNNLKKDPAMKDALTEFQKAEKCLKDKISQTKPKP